MANTKITTNVIADGAITSAKLDTDISISGSITGTLATAAQPNITSVGTLTGFTSTGIDDNADATAITIDSSENVGIGTTSGDVFGRFYARSVSIDSSGVSKLQINSATGQYAGIDFGVNGTRTADINSSASSLAINTIGAIPMTFITNGTERMRISSGGDISFYDDTGTSQALFWDASAESLGIGTTSPSAPLNISATYSSDTTEQFRIQDNTGGKLDFFGYSNGGKGIQAYADDGSTFYNLNLQPLGGNVGIGTTSPSSFYSGARQLVVGSGSGEQGITVYGGNAETSYLLFADGTSGAELYAGQVNYSHANNSLNFHTNGITTPRMTIDSSGNLLVGTTYAALNARQVVYATGSGASTRTQTLWNGGGAGCTYVQFVSSTGSQVGSITQNGTSAVAYNTSSDYRLKENVDYDFTALDRVAQLKPARFNFIEDADNTVDGFLAHEVQDIVPEAITGEKDAVREEEYEITPAVLDDDGNVVTEAVMGTREVPEYQGIDQSKLVPLLTKAIQEQQTIIDNLKTRIEALEG